MIEVQLSNIFSFVIINPLTYFQIFLVLLAFFSTWLQQRYPKENSTFILTIFMRFSRMLAKALDFKKQGLSVKFVTVLEMFQQSKGSIKAKIKYMATLRQSLSLLCLNNFLFFFKIKRNFENRMNRSMRFGVLEVKHLNRCNLIFSIFKLRNKCRLYQDTQLCTIHRIQIEWTSLSKKMQGLAWELFLYCVN